MGRYAARTGGIEPFLAMEVLERAQAMERDGVRVLHLEIGEPDFPAPASVLAATRLALDRGQTRYTDSRGLAELRGAIARDKGRRAGVDVDPERVLVTQGTSPAMLLTFSLLLEAGDEVLIPSPHYPCYPSFVRLFGGVPVFVPTDPERGYAIDPARMREALTPRTRALVYGSPANPTGAVQERATVEALASLGPTVVADEIYDGLLYDGAAVASALAATDDAFVLDGFSKRHAMTGFRLGYVVAPSAAMRTLQVLQQNLFISASELAQRGGLAALAEGDASVRSMAAAYGRRRSLLVEGLRKLGFGVPTLPPGAFYVLADARRWGADSRRLAFRLLEEAHVAVTPGVDFGAAGEGFLRFCYAASEDVIAEAIARLGDVLGAPS